MRAKRARYPPGKLPGAVSVPFYDVTSYLEQLPRDVWIVAYCGCPHAASEQASAVLLENGFTKVKVLDEGLPLWEQLEYPMKPGPKP